MGSRFSKALRPRKAAGATVSSEQLSTMHNANAASKPNTEPRQDPATQPSRELLPEVRDRTVISSDDLDLPSTRSTPQRRNSAPFQDRSVATRTDMDRPTWLSAFEQFCAEHSLRFTDHGAATTESRPPPAEDTRSYTPPPPDEDEPQCLTCCTKLPRKEDPNYHSEVIRPCASCASEICTKCLRDMFLEACKDMTRMPPRCCSMINLHHARPFLTDDEAALFRSKYEEWSTPKPFYCPVPVCSAFIPERLLPRQAVANRNDKQRVDSGFGTPAAVTFACPTCNAEICTSCRQVGHPGLNCEINEFGLDAKTAELLKSWGYKQCPKCGHGIKKMYGCSHMECKCGAHFCWGCLKSRGDCDNCGNDDDEYIDFEPDEPEELETLQRDTTPEGSATPATAEEDSGSSPKSAEPHRPRNLDGGAAEYWEDTGIDFGDEPSDDIPDMAWHCDHYFDEYNVTPEEALRIGSRAHGMECVKCWNPIYPGVNERQNAESSSIGDAERSAEINTVEEIRHLWAYDTAGTSPQLFTDVSQFSPPATTADPQFMDDIEYTSPRPHPRTSNSERFHVFANMPETSTPAHECSNCNILVCTPCANALTAEEDVSEEEGV